MQTGISRKFLRGHPPFGGGSYANIGKDYCCTIRGASMLPSSKEEVVRLGKKSLQPEEEGINLFYGKTSCMGEASGN